MDRRTFLKKVGLGSLGAAAVIDGKEYDYGV